ncbi:MAG: hypothetical protein ACD_80C00109G0011 [uncultured bacterium (gcode 4)]|uniref:Tyrosine--tRNA ligase n=1 Tax=uncultured bacterium (gcode 4) TaxID=1234023 RepID=K1XJ52_9BACT|nr:MAG: hypothetical protein ACD_80C00109G0011 [uncultured bacterium (gcode 4)]
MKLREEREQRGIINQFSNEKVFDLLDAGGQKFYIWFDPSADSLQLGNMFSVMAAIHLMRYGNKCYFLVGWATGMIGDPSLKDAERKFLSEEELRHNEQCIYNQLKHFLENIQKNYDIKFDYEMVDNYDFYKNMNYLKFLSEVGKYITVNTMIAKESVKKRIEDPDKSITYAEFSYMLIQGYDFVHLYQNEGVKIQLWWSDQRWNVTTGMEIIRKKLDQEAFCLTIPLITDASGKKFWKSEWNAIWVDEKKNSPYFVYQFFMNVEDALVGKLLKVFSLKTVAEIDIIVAKHMENPSDRYGQKELANRVVEVLFWKDAVKQAEKISEIFFGQGDKLETIKIMSSDDIKALQKETGGTTITNYEWSIINIFTQAGLTESNGEAKKLIASGWLYCNENKITDLQHMITKQDFINGVLLLRKGKKQFKIVNLVS